ncbi:transglutaminase-like domain-containing protein [Mangrovivirga sp. M17]|uniref:Transglutaminase-like domain-containing protein n=1 Tax=Mangrovivirga halotolerans TaxID=2993936 RepID=A0ABT3RS00_9BACT|nr:transglutaminase-like domain-containing protein [Mangrovivirga halotolerans]MCX2744129.1 transglutaminase-like domain-containing protein [Mangrovivirga halotolerans]
MRITKLITLFCFSFLIFTSCNYQENTTSEDESKDVKSSNEKVTVEDVERGIRENIASQTQEGNGYFKFSNDTTDFNLKLVRVHTEYLSVLGPNEFFACVDLATESGDVYDVDFFLNGTKNEMTVTRTDLHKLNGKPYYTWKQNKDKTWVTVPVEQASNKLMGVIEGQDNFSFTYEATIPEITENAEVWIPIAQSDEFQTIEIISIETPGEHKMISDPDFDNSILYMNLDPSHSGKKISINYEVNRLEKGPYEEDSDPSKYLQANKLLPIGDRFAVIANDVIEKREASTPLTKARALYDHVIEEVRYAKQGTYGTGDADYACDSKSGNCTEFHSLFISLARSAGIPARFAVGAAIPSSRNEGGVNGYHCWAEFYAEGKWWPVDISEADKYTALATYYFGHHPANRIEFSRGRDIKPEIMPKSGSINFLAYPVLEIKGEPVRVDTKFTFNRDTKI